MYVQCIKYHWQSNNCKRLNGRMTFQWMPAVVQHHWCWISFDVAKHLKLWTRQVMHNLVLIQWGLCWDFDNRKKLEPLSLSLNNLQWNHITCKKNYVELDQVCWKEEFWKICEKVKVVWVHDSNSLRNVRLSNLGTQLVCRPDTFRHQG